MKISGASPTVDQPSAPPSSSAILFQRYRILGHLGAGGMGSVYLAEQTGPGGFRREVVLKVIRVDGAANEEQRLLLLDEAQLTGLISHPNVITLHEAGEHQGQLYLALERVRGVSLTQLLQRLESRKLPVAVAAGLIAQACQGLHAAHELEHEGHPLQLVHRDVSLSNLMCDVEGRVRVIDFGIAHTAVRRVETAANFVRGNVMYMAPEQRTGGPLDRRVDIYSTALVFCTLCIGGHPARKSEQPTEFQPLSAHCPDIPPALDALVAACLAPEPADRPSRISSLGMALRMVAQAGGFADPAALARYFHERGISLEPPAPRPLGPADFAKLRPTKPSAVPPPPSPATEVEENTAVRRAPRANSLQIARDGPTLREWLAPDGRRVCVHNTWLKERGQRIALSSVLPAPLFALRVNSGLRLNCDESAAAAPGFSRSALYADASRPQTRLPYLLLSARADSPSFDVGHRRSLVRRVSVTFGEPSGSQFVAWLPEFNLEICSPSGAVLLVVLATQDEFVHHLECIHA